MSDALVIRTIAKMVDLEGYKDSARSLYDVADRLDTKPVPPAFRCSNCDNGIELEWEYCAWCGAIKDWVAPLTSDSRAETPAPQSLSAPERHE